MPNAKKITSFPQGRVTVPPSKSVAHRSLICAVLSGGGVTVDNLELSQDIKATLRCISALGGKYTYENNRLVMHTGLTKPAVGTKLDCGESGSTLRFFIPIALALGADVEFVGAARLFERPLQPYIQAFTGKDISITKTDNGIYIKGSLKSGEYSLTGDVSSQFITGLLFALPLLSGASKITMLTPLESKGYVDLTLYELELFGVNIKNNNYTAFEIEENSSYKPNNRTVEGDFSNGAFMLTAAALGCDVTVAGLNPNSRQGDKAFIDILEKTGAKVEYLSNNDIKVTTPNGLNAIDIDVTEIPDLVPPITALLCFCKGVSNITGAARLRIKESDRLQTVSSELNKLGAKITERADSLTVVGTDHIYGGACVSHNDHRIAMMCAVAGIKANMPIMLQGFTSVEKSYPTFWKDWCVKEQTPLVCKNIVLVGLPGCGKTTLGYTVAKNLGFDFIDLDSYIETQNGKTIPEIFETVGEQEFRKLESLACTEVSQFSNTIISTGGGVVLNQKNTDILSSTGIIIFLDRSTDNILQGLNANGRPLLKDNPQKLLELDNIRRPLYELCASYIFDCNDARHKTKEKLIKLCKEITVKKQFFVIGTPIKHSLSPTIHLPVLERYLCAPSYDIKTVEKTQLGSFIQEVRDEGVAGFNVTMPHKMDIIPYLDKVSTQAKLLNSVNTVVNNNGVLTGYSTDGQGFHTSFTEHGYTFTGANVLIIGAGGASTAVAVYLANKCVASITVLARRQSQAKQVVDLIKKANPVLPVDYAEFTKDILAQASFKTDVLINATSLGMQGTSYQFEDFNFLQNLNPTAVVCDLIYKPAQTLLLQKAKELGYNTLGGIYMLINQALIADEYYLNTKLSFPRFKEIIQKNIENLY